jgi:hypothetical protein
MLSYTPDHPFPDPGWSHDGDRTQDGAWLEVGGKSAMILVGTKGERTDINGWVYYGEPGIDGCGYKGWHAEPYSATIFFYDTDELAAVADGTNPNAWDVEPYAVFDVNEFLINPYACVRAILGGAAYDSTNNLLYIQELRGDGYSPVIHVFQIADGEGTADTTSPTQVTGVSTTVLTASTTQVDWNAATDDSGRVQYVVYRNGLPVKFTGTNQWIDIHTDVYPDATYMIEARDPVRNKSFSSGAEPPAGDGNVSKRKPLAAGGHALVSSSGSTPIGVLQ